MFLIAFHSSEDLYFLRPIYIFRYWNSISPKNFKDELYYLNIVIIFFRFLFVSFCFLTIRTPQLASVATRIKFYLIYLILPGLIFERRGSLPCQQTYTIYSVVYTVLYIILHYVVYITLCCTALHYTMLCPPRFYSVKV